MAHKTVIGGSNVSASQLKEMFNQIASGALNGVHMQALIEHRNPFGTQEVTHRFPVWKTIRLGTSLKTADDFRTAIKSAGMYISDWGDDILGNPAFMVSSEETEVDLVVVSNAELGFKNGAKLEDAYARAMELGLELCPNEVGPQLLLQYEDQPNGEWLLIAMEPIVDSLDFCKLFIVEHDSYGRRYLSSSSGNPGSVWSAGTRLVFRRRK